MAKNIRRGSRKPHPRRLKVEAVGKSDPDYAIVMERMARDTGERIPLAALRQAAG